MVLPEPKPLPNDASGDGWAAFGFDSALATEGATKATTAVTASASTTIDRVHAALPIMVAPCLTSLAGQR